MLYIILTLITFALTADLQFKVDLIDDARKSSYCYDISNNCYVAEGSISAATESKISFTYKDYNENFNNIGLHEITISDIEENEEYTLDFDYPNTTHPIFIYFSDTKTKSYIALNYRFPKVVCQGNAKFSFKRIDSTIAINAYHGPFEFYVDPNDPNINYMTFDYSYFLTKENKVDNYVCLSIYEKPTTEGYENNVKYARYEKAIISIESTDNFKNMIKSDYSKKTYVKPVYAYGPSIVDADWTSTADNLLYIELSKDNNNNIRAAYEPYSFIGVEHLYCDGYLIPLLATTIYITDLTFSSCSYINSSTERFNIEFNVIDSLYTFQLYNFSASSSSNLFISYKKASRTEDTHSRKLINIIDVEISQNVKTNENISRIKKDSEFSLSIAHNSVEFTPLSGLIRAQHKCNDYDYLYDISNFIYGIFKTNNNNSIDSNVSIKLNTGEITELNYDNNLFSAIMGSNTKNIIYIPPYHEASTLYLNSIEIMSIIFFILIFAITLTILVLIVLTQKKNKKN